MLPYLLTLMLTAMPEEPGEPLYLARCQGTVIVQAVLLEGGNKPSPSPSPLPQPVPPSPADCKCGGTKHSGDGIGPCICGDSCICSRREEPPEPQLGPALPFEPAPLVARTVCVCQGVCRCDPSCSCRPQCEGGVCYPPKKAWMQESVKLPTMSKPANTDVSPPSKAAPPLEMLIFVSTPKECPHCKKAIDDHAAGRLPMASRLVYIADSPGLFKQHVVPQIPTYLILVNGKETMRHAGYLKPADATRLLPGG